MLILLSWFGTLHRSITFSQDFLLPCSYIYTLCVGVSVAFSPLLQCVGAGNVWRGQRKETEEEIWHSNLLQRCIPCVHYAIISWNINPTTPARQTILSEIINFRIRLKNLALIDVMHLAAPTGAADLRLGNGRTLAGLVAGGRRKSQGCNPEQETCLSQQSKHRPSSAHSND